MEYHYVRKIVKFETNTKNFLHLNYFGKILGSDITSRFTWNMYNYYLLAHVAHNCLWQNIYRKESCDTRLCLFRIRPIAAATRSLRFAPLQSTPSTRSGSSWSPFRRHLENNFKIWLVPKLSERRNVST